MRIVQNPRIQRIPWTIVFAHGFDDEMSTAVPFEEAITILIKDDYHDGRPPMMIHWVDSSVGSWCSVSRHPWGFYLLSPSGGDIFTVYTSDETSN